MKPPIPRRSRSRIRTIPPAPLPLRLLLLPACGLDPSAYRILATRVLSAGWGGVRLHVIGASSLVVVETAAAALAEVVTCGPAGAVGPALAAARPGPRGGRAHVWSEGSGFAYEAELWGAPLGESAAGAALPESLEYRFPGAGDPLTRIEASVREDGLDIRTRHDYPERGLAVWTESRFRWR